MTLPVLPVGERYAPAAMEPPMRADKAIDAPAGPVTAWLEARGAGPS